MKKNRITVVAGLGRCGTTMAMKMLSAGGLPVVAENYKSFEDMRTIGNDFAAFMQCMNEARGGAVKILDPHLSWLASPALRTKFKTDIQFIFLKRDFRQQGNSQAKFLIYTQGIPVNRQVALAMAASCRRDTEIALAACKAIGPVYVAWFEDILKSPKIHAAAMAEFVGQDLDTEAMAAAVIERPAKCLQYMLEEWL